MSELVNRERLTAYQVKSKLLDGLLYQKRKLEDQLSGVSGIDYSKSRVTSGNSHFTSEEENYVLKLEKINRKIKDARDYLSSEYDVIFNQIKRISSEYQGILIMRYLEGEEWNYIIEIMYATKPDFEIYKNTKYHTYVMAYHKKALIALENVSKKSFIPTEEQLSIL